jgi:malonyl CoA-acyl carrier protein transacylase/SAM-dependent methyltransferase/acyl carrier protein
MRHRKITAQASHRALNPKIPAFDEYHMAIPQEIMPWQAPTLLALVNSYGAAGSNSAVMLREKPFSRRAVPTTPRLSKYPLFISAGSVNSLSQYSKKLLNWLKKAEAESEANLLPSVAFHLADRGNHQLPHVVATTVSSVRDLEIKLEEVTGGSGTILSTSTASQPVVLVFGGQESDFIGVSEDVYRSSLVLRKHLDSIDRLLISAGLEIIFPAVFESRPPGNLVTLHSALFAVQYASAKAWIDCGLKVDAVVGHSFGQLTALCISGALSLADALKLVSGRASLMKTHWGLEPGSMLFLQADRKTVNGIVGTLSDAGLYAEIACYNGPTSHVLVGSSEAIEFLQRHVADTPHLRNSIRTQKLNVTNGFHSQFTEPMLAHLASLAEQLEWRHPNIHLETTDEFQSNSEPDFRIVSQHTRRPVFFQQAIERLTAKFSHCTWIEAGRGSSVMKLGRGSVVDPQGHAFYSPQLTSAKAQESLVDVTVDLWKKGYAVQYWPFHRSQKTGYDALSIPPIQFEKTRHWLPFRARSPLKEHEAAEVVKEEEQTHELLTLIHSKDKANSQAVFQIDPHAERFKKMLGGHVMDGQTLAPASLYFEVVARAALLLQKDTGTTYVPTVDDLHMRSPIGQDTNTKILLVLTKLNDALPAWSFSITTQPADVPSAEPFEVSTGRVCLKKRDDAQQARDFERYETLTGHRRYEEVLDHPDAETMQGSHIYRAFNTVVFYDKPFQGIKRIACVGFEAAGKVRIRPAPEDPADQRLVDTPMTDSFMQFAGFLVNYFNNPSTEDVLVCGKIEYIELDGSFDPDAGEWLVYSTMSEGGETDAWSDAYVFDARTKKMVMAAFGFRFSRMPRTLLGRILKSVNKSANTSKKIPAKDDIPDDIDDDSVHLLDQPQSTASAPARSRRPVGKRRELLQILSNVTDVPLAELRDDSSLEDLGIDSLMATEVRNDIRSGLCLTIDLSSFLFFPNVGALAAYIDDKLGVGTGGDDIDSGVSDVETETPNSKPGTVTPASIVTVDEPKSSKQDVPTLISARDAFEETRLNYDQHAKTTQAVDFWEEAYPHQVRLVQAYIVEAFAALGYNLASLKPGDRIPVVESHEKHGQLVHQLYRALEDGGLITRNSSGGDGDINFTLTAAPIDPTPAETIYHDIIDLHPQHASVLKLVRAVGSEMAACLRGDKEGIQVVFGNRETKRTLEEMYEFWPLLRAPSLILGDFLVEAFRNSTGARENGGKFRILEVGAGTGGTTRYILDRLRREGIEFEYVFTDLGASLVNAAAKGFKNKEGLVFDVLDIEQEPRDEYRGAFHAVIATNCIHATRNLEVSLRHARQMLRDDGALGLIEITQNMYWLDIVVGLFEGWWMFEDGRKHALADERHWEKRIKSAGFEEVSWSDGTSPEAKTVRVIAAFPSQGEAVPEKSVKAAMETVVYKRVGNLDIHADIYYPLEGEVPLDRKLPVGK